MVDRVKIYYCHVCLLYEKILSNFGDAENTSAPCLLFINLMDARNDASLQSFVVYRLNGQRFTSRLVFRNKFDANCFITTDTQITAIFIANRIKRYFHHAAYLMAEMNFIGFKNSYRRYLIWTKEKNERIERFNYLQQLFAIKTILYRT